MEKPAVSGYEKQISPTIDGHAIARVLYWASLLLLLSGAWLLIQPFTRLPGESVQIYITLAAFEVYAWLLLVLGRWQVRKGLAFDVVRSGIFALVLMGLIFITINELYYISKLQGYLAAGLFTLLAILKLFVGPRLVGISLPKPFFASCVAWIVAMAGPAVVIVMLPLDSSVRHGVGYFSFWFVAILIAAHIPLVGWHLRHDKSLPDNSPLQSWQMPWVIVGVLAFLGVAQLYFTVWGLAVEAAPWYYGPVLLAATVVFISLAMGRGCYRILAWSFLGLVILCVASRWDASVPPDLPAAWQNGFMSHIVHPVYPNPVWLCVLFVLMAVSLQRLLLLVLAATPVLAVGVIVGCRAMLKWKYGRGLAVLLGAFVVLLLGVLTQWYQTRYRPGKSNGRQTLSNNTTPPAIPDLEDADDST